MGSHAIRITRLMTRWSTKLVWKTWSEQFLFSIVWESSQAILRLLIHQCSLGHSALRWELLWQYVLICVFMYKLFNDMTFERKNQFLSWKLFHYERSEVFCIAALWWLLRPRSAKWSKLGLGSIWLKALWTISECFVGRQSGSLDTSQGGRKVMLAIVQTTVSPLISI